MSRSYKKRPIFSDYGRKRTAFYKRHANKKVRKNKNIINGNMYKKNGVTYNICDYKFYCPNDKKAYRK